MRIMYPIMASIAGAVTALSFRPFQGMGKTQILLAIFVGFSFAYFVGPWAVRVILGNEADARMQGGIYYLLASGSNALIPMAVKWLGRIFGAHQEEPK